MFTKVSQKITLTWKGRTWASNTDLHLWSGGSKHIYMHSYPQKEKLEKGVMPFGGDYWIETGHWMTPSCLPNGNAPWLSRGHLSTPRGKNLCGYTGPENKVNLNPTWKLITLSSLKLPRHTLSIKYTFPACQGRSMGSRSYINKLVKY